ncbi:MAG: hypothetical protein ACYTFA_07780 [Planctomycetota bacterium]|jgi:hypothetical protein
MQEKISITLVLLSLTALLANTGCPVVDGGGGSDGSVVISEITYSFRDASIPPEYHRSYTITVTADMARVVIDSYGDILADEEYVITDEQFADITSSLENHNISNCTLDENADCAGGTSEDVSYADGDREAFSGTVHHCGGLDSGDLCGDVAGFADDVRSLVPDFDALMQGTQEQ